MSTLTRSKPMNRGAGFQRLPPGHPDRAARPDRSDEFASWTPRARPVAEAVMAADLAERPPATVPGKVAGRRDQRIRDSARGEDCHVRLAGICDGRTDTTVWSHFPGLDGDRGMGIKSLDACGAYACMACHDAVDGRTHNTPGHDRSAILMAWFHGHMRSLVTLHRKGLL